MFEAVLAQLSELFLTLVTNRGLLGALGATIFIGFLIAFYVVPRQIRESRTGFFVELVVGPLVVIVVALGVDWLFSVSGVELLHKGINPIYSVSLVLLTAHLVSRGLRIFLWDALLSKGSAAPPRIIWNLFQGLIYISAVYGILAFVYQQPMTGFVVSSGVTLGVLGLSLQQMLSDIFAGIGLSIERPFSPGEWIELEDGTMGEVVEIDWRATQIRTWNNTICVVPNSKLTGAMINNYDRPDRTYGFWFYLTVSRTIPPDLVRRLLLEAAIKSPGILDDPSPTIRLSDTETQPMRYMVFVYCRDYRESFIAKDQVIRNAWDLFSKAGITFAANPQDIEISQAETHQVREQEAEILLKEITLFEPLSDAERKKIADEGTIAAYLPGDVVIRENEEGSSMFIILSGMVRVHRDLDGGGILDIARLGTFDYFGEMSLLTGEVRSASVTAHTDCQILEIKKVSLEPLIAHRPELVAEIGKIMAERKLRSELLTAESQKISMSERLRNYSEVITNSIARFFAK